MYVSSRTTRPPNDAARLETPNHERITLSPRTRPDLSTLDAPKNVFREAMVEEGNGCSAPEAGTTNASNTTTTSATIRTYADTTPPEGTGSVHRHRYPSGREATSQGPTE